MKKKRAPIIAALNFAIVLVLTFSVGVFSPREGACSGEAWERNEEIIGVSGYEISVCEIGYGPDMIIF